MPDVHEQIRAIHRSLGLTQVEGRDATVVVATRTYDAPVDDVWDAITNPERLPRWFMPVSGDLKLGGRYQLHGNAGGTVLECEPSKRLAVTWEFGGEVSWVEILLTASGSAATLLELRHTAHVSPERWREFGPGAVGMGWDLGLLGLDQHLTVPGGGITPEVAEEWTVSDEGKLFMTLSSEGWFTASVLAGTDEAEARAAADRCLAFYTGVPAAPAAGEGGPEGSEGADGPDGPAPA